MAYVDFVGQLHTRTKRDYLGRVNAHDKAEVAEIATKFGKDYWDGERHLGYGGYRYDGRWRPVAEEMAQHYGLKAGARILDVGCGKGFLLYEFTQVVPGCEVHGIDISQYAVDHAKEEIKHSLRVGHARELPWPDDYFDLVVSINTLHNLYNFDLESAIQEIERVGRGAKYVCIEGYRNEREKTNLIYWQLTCRAFHSLEEWEWLFNRLGYAGDYSCIFFE